MYTFKLFFLFLIIFNIYYLADCQRLNKAKFCKCRTRATGRIVGGKEIDYPVPWQVGLAIRKDDGSLEHLCGGTIINHNYIFTAAHCGQWFTGSNPQININTLRIRVGINELDEPITEENTFLAKRVIIDSRYVGNEASEIGDFAMIELKGRIRFSDKIQPACLPTDEIIKYEGEGVLVATGWGSITNTGFDKFGDFIPAVVSNKLKQANFTEDRTILDYKDSTRCRSFLICLKRKETPDTPDDSVCNGDSGGPLQYTQNGKTRVVGIAQFVLGNTYKDGSSTFCDGLGGYGRVAFYLNNLKDIVGDNYCDV